MSLHKPTENLEVRDQNFVEIYENRPKQISFQTYELYQCFDGMISSLKITLPITILMTFFLKIKTK